MQTPGKSRVAILLSNKRFHFLLICLLSINALILAGFTLLLHLEASKNNTPQLKNYPELKAIENKKDAALHQITFYFEDIARRKGAVYAFEVLEQVTLPPNTDFHLIAHSLGQILYEQHGVEGIIYCDNNFGNGCSHSLVINEFINKGTDAIKTIAETCRNAPGGEVSYIMCYHGVGHGVLGYTNYDLMQALELCKAFKPRKTSQTEYTECSGGVFMEMIFGLHEQRIWETKKDQYLGASDPLYLCRSNSIPKEVEEVCYIYLTPYFYQYLNVSMTQADDATHKKAMAFCNRIPIEEKNNRLSCYGGFGKEFIPIAHGKDLRNLDKMSDAELKKAYFWCTLAENEDGIRSCLKFAVQSSYWGGRFPTTPRKFCNIIQDSTHNRECLKYISSYDASLN